jgi:capsular polysaccharide biosynthesis protein
MSQKKPNKIVRGLRTVVKKSLGFIVVVLILAFISYHFYSVFVLAKNFNKATGPASSQASVQPQK